MNRRYLQGTLHIQLFLAATACTNFATIHGARPIQPHTTEFGVAGSVQGGTAFSDSTGLLLPQLELSVRRGLSESSDVGTRLYLGGAQADFRHRFWRNDKWHLAIAPGIGGLFLPVGGILSLQIPLRAELELSPSWSLMAGVQSTAQHNFVALPPYTQDSITYYTTATLRIERQWKRLRLGSSLEVLDHSTQGVPATVSLGWDVSLRPKSIK